MKGRLIHTTRFVLVEIAAVVMLAGMVAALAGWVQPALSSWGLVLAGIVLALLPSLIWLVIFLQEDKIHPEPKQSIVGVFILGALLARGIGQPLLNEVFQVQDWMGRNLLVDLVGSILIVGIVQEFLKYAAVRYTVFNSPVFDERSDGILYGATAGLGYAVTLNLQYVVGSGGVNLSVGVIHVVIVALAQASFSGVLGTFLSEAKFGRPGRLWLSAGLLAAAILNGLVTLVLSQVSFIVQLGFNPWYGLVVAAVVAGMTFAILLTRLHRLEMVQIAPQ